jgi:BirA family biotin operon repressor/biotin-[acetyl-CoA-carboxylase] ligase
MDLGAAGENGLPLDSSPGFRQQLEVCRQWGFQLDIAGGRIRLRYDHEQLVPAWIQQETPATAWERLEIFGFLSVGSTNGEAIDLARRGAPGGTLIYAEEQTAGKGRKERSWFSPAGVGLYFSLVLRPEQPRRAWPLLAHAASVALVETLKGLYEQRLISNQLDVDLKWPNDVLLSGNKCAGILLEALPAEAVGPAAVVGVGVNVHEVDGPVPEAPEAACVDRMARMRVPRRRILTGFLRHFQQWYLAFERGEHGDLLERWKSFSSMWTGTQIRISDSGEPRAGITCGLNEYGALLVRTADGRVETLLAGDVSIRKTIEPDERSC